MAEMVISAGAVYIIGGQNTANPANATVDPDMYIDLSEYGLTMRINTSRETAELRRHDGSDIPHHLPGPKNGTLSISFVRQDSADVNPHKTFAAIERIHKGVFSFIVVIDRATWIAADQSGQITPVPAAPAYVGMAVANEINYWGEGDGSAAGIITVNARLSRYFDIIE